MGRRSSSHKMRESAVYYPPLSWSAAISNTAVLAMQQHFKQHRPMMWDSFTAAYRHWPVLHEMDQSSASSQYLKTNSSPRYRTLVSQNTTYLEKLRIQVKVVKEWQGSYQIHFKSLMLMLSHTTVRFPTRGNKSCNVTFLSIDSLKKKTK